MYQPLKAPIYKALRLHGGGIRSEEQAKNGAAWPLPPEPSHVRFAVLDLQKRVQMYKFGAWTYKKARLNVEFLWFKS